MGDEWVESVGVKVNMSLYSIMAYTFVLSTIQAVPGVQRSSSPSSDLYRQPSTSYMIIIEQSRIGFDMRSKVVLYISHYYIEYSRRLWYEVNSKVCFIAWLLDNGWWCMPE